jgi:DNA-binding MarR family transcriptional regulator
MVQLASHPGMASAEMARTILVTPQAMTGLLGSLQELGLITRDESAGHGRRIPAQLTAEGRQLLQRCAAAVANVERSLGLNADQATQLNRLLHVVIATER